MLFAVVCVIVAVFVSAIPEFETVTVVVSTQPTDQTVNETQTATFNTLGDVMSILGATTNLCA